jgi:amino acid adenylation domain-containing protein
MSGPFQQSPMAATTTTTLAALHDLIAAQAERTPDAIAVRFGDQAQTYAQLETRATAIAAALRTAGAGSGRFVAVCIQRSLDLPAALLGVLKTGAAYIPLDPAFPAQRIETILDDSGAVAILASRGVALPDTHLAVVRVEDVVADFVTLPAAETTGLDAAYLIYTSGSTGKPKGVVVTHANVQNFMESMAKEPGLAAGDVLLAVTTVSFDIAALELFLPLTVGATVVIASRDEAMDGDRLRVLIDTHKVTVMQATPATWRILIGAEWAGSPTFRALCGGEPLPSDLAAQLLTRTGELWNMYGPTETTIWSTIFRVRDARAPILIGKPIAATQCYVLDEQGRPCDAGATGELYIGGAGVARGYWNRPELTSEKFLDDPCLSGNRIYRTGDLARWTRDGELECLGRIDFQVKLRGFRIEPGEIEAALREHDVVDDAAVGVREHGPGDLRLVAWVRLRGGARLDESILRVHVASRVPEYMVPQHFMAIAEMPRLLNGKLDRKSLPFPFASDPSTRTTGALPGTNPDQQGTPLERALAAIWCEVLGTNEAIGLEERFFDRGGTSLLALNVLSRLRAHLGTRIPATKFFAAPTLSQFAQMLEKDYSEQVRAWVGGTRPAAVPGPGSGPAVHGRALDRPASSAREADGLAIAIVGMACKTPGAESLAEFWDMVCAGREGIRDLSDPELDAAGVPRLERESPSYVKRGGVLKDAYAFDAEFFGYSPREAELMDPQHRVLLETAWHALEDAAIVPGGDTRVGVYVGVAHNHYFDRAVAAQPQLRWGDSGFQTQLGADKDYAATRIAFKLDLRGPAIALQTACSSSGIAIHLACQALRAGDCDAAIVGGARVNAPDAGYVHVDGGPQAVDGRVRPFDKNASGMVLASGAAVLVLKTLERARADEDRIYAVIKGSAINNDGADKIAFTAPSEAGQLDVIRRALAHSGVDPATIGLVEAHGTGTHLGDPIEVAALAQGYDRAERIALGSVKANVGHLDAGAGAIGMIKAALALHHQVLPPSIHCQEANPECAFEKTPFFVNTEHRPWPAEGARRAAVSSFGFGGTNFHCILEEAPADLGSPRADARGPYLLKLSARTDAALQRQARCLAAWLRAHPEANLADVAFTLDVGRALLPRRAAVVARDLAQAADRLSGLVGADATTSSSPSLVMMFPGQGVQYAGMGAQLYRDEPVFRACMDRCAEVLKAKLGLDLRDLLYGDDATADDKLRETRLAQPAIFAVSYSIAHLWRNWGLKPAAMVGHSVGEFVAATLAGVFELPDALNLVAERGALMQSMAPGAMLAVRLGEASVAGYLSPGVEIATLNAPQLTVLSGPAEALAVLQSQLALHGVSATLLRTSHAFHSSSMDAAAQAFAKVVEQTPRNPAREAIVSTRTGKFVTPDELLDPQYWARQIREPVRFTDAVTELLRTRGRVFLECGPGHSLSGAVRQSLLPEHGAMAIPSLPHDAKVQPATEFLLGAAGRLFVAGLKLDAQRVYAAERRCKLSLPGYPFARTRYALPIVAGEPAVDEAVHAPSALAADASSIEVSAEVQQRAMASTATEAPPKDPMVGYVLEALHGLTGKTFESQQIDATFMELGLDSLVLMQLASKIRNDLHTELRFRSLLETHTSVRALAQALQ